ncbi:hypothetical protein I2485_01985 [Nesterenkonia sp. E16_7]|nr:hypothetical protein [Nesterenkonia sp. E16_10]MBO0597418.1 hypothetical protein [Nesterenkonia sp. E16_7]
MTALIRRSLPGASRVPPGAQWTGPCAAWGWPVWANGKGIRTTIPAKDGVRAGDLLNRDFTADAPNRVWVADFTYVRTWAGWSYVAHRRCLRPADHRVERGDHQRDRAGGYPAAHGDLAA